MNRLVDSINLWEEIVNSRWFLPNTRVMLCLNKYDVFCDKISRERVPITVCFPDYKGDPASPVESLEHIRQVFMGRVHNQANMPFPPLVHVMNALDGQDVRKLVELTCENAPR